MPGRARNVGVNHSTRGGQHNGCQIGRGCSRGGVAGGRARGSAMEARYGTNTAAMVSARSPLPPRWALV